MPSSPPKVPPRNPIRKSVPPPWIPPARCRPPCESRSDSGSGAGRHELWRGLVVLNAHCPYVETGPGPVLTLAEIRVPGGIPHRDLRGTGVTPFRTVQPYNTQNMGLQAVGSRYVVDIQNSGSGRHSWGAPPCGDLVPVPAGPSSKDRGGALDGSHRDAPGSRALASVPGLLTHLTHRQRPERDVVDHSALGRSGPSRSVHERM